MSCHHEQTQGECQQCSANRHNALMGGSVSDSTTTIRIDISKPEQMLTAKQLWQSLGQAYAVIDIYEEGLEKWLKRPSLSRHPISKAQIKELMEKAR